MAAQQKIKFINNLEVGKDLNILGNLVVDGNFTVTGRSTVSILEEVVTDENTLILRRGVDRPLEDTEFCGIVAENYDGEKNNGRLIFDNKGIAYVGDQEDEKPLVVRELSCIEDNTADDQHIILWNQGTLSLQASSLYESETGIENDGLILSNVELADIRDATSGKVLTTREYVAGLFNNLLQLTQDHTNTLPLWYENGGARQLKPSNLKQTLDGLVLSSGVIVVGRSTTDADTVNTLVNKSYLADKIEANNQAKFQFGNTNNYAAFWNSNNKYLAHATLYYDGTDIRINSGAIYGFRDIVSTDADNILTTKKYVEDTIQDAINEIAERTIEALLANDELMMNLTDAVMNRMNRWEPRQEGY